MIDSFRALSLPKKIVVVIGALALFQFATSGQGNRTATTSLPPTATEGRAAAANQSAAPSPAAVTPTATPAATSPHSATPAPPTPTPDRRWITGLTNTDFTGNLQARNMACLRVAEFDTPTGRRSGWSCKDTIGGIVVLRADTVSASEVQVERVLAAVAITGGTPSQADEAARSFLGFVATLPIQGSDPLAARQWVEANVTSTNAQAPRATFGSGVFIVGKTFIGNAPYYTLEIRSLGYPSVP